MLNRHVAIPAITPTDLFGKIEIKQGDYSHKSYFCKLTQVIKRLKAIRQNFCDLEFSYMNAALKKEVKFETIRDGIIHHLFSAQQVTYMIPIFSQHQCIEELNNLWKDFCLLGAEYQKVSHFLEELESIFNIHNLGSLLLGNFNGFYETDQVNFISIEDLSISLSLMK